MKKRILAAVMCGMMVMAGCSGGGGGQSSPAAQQTSAATQAAGAETSGEETKEADVAPEETKKYSFAFFTNTLNNTFHNAMVEVYTQKCKEMGYDFVTYDSDYDASMQISQLEDAASKGFDAIFLIPADSQSERQGVEAVHNAGIPIFNVDTPIADMDLMVTCIATDAYSAGKAMGEQLVADYPDGGKIALLEHPENDSAVARINGFLDGMGDSASKFDIVARQNCGSALDQSLTITEDIIQANPDLTAIFCVNGTSGMGSVAALKEHGMDGKIGVYCIDASPDNKAAMVEGSIKGVAAQCPKVIAQTSFEKALEYLDGKEIEKEILIPSYAVTMEQAKETMNDWQ